MTADGLAGEVGSQDHSGTGTGSAPPRSAPAEPASVASAETALVVCDRSLGEIGRRSHRFAWLRPPDGGAHEWIPVDAYYPAHRLVAVCRAPEPSPLESLCAELVPAHGLRLLVLDLVALGREPDGLERAISRKIAALGPLRPPPSGAGAGRSGASGGSGGDAVRPPPLEGVVARAFASLAASGSRRAPAGPRAQAAERAARLLAARKRGATPRAPSTVRPVRPPTERAAPPRPRSTRSGRDDEAARTRRGGAAAARKRWDSRRVAGQHAGPSLVAGAALMVAIALELYLAVAVAAIAGGHVLLAAGLALDAGARALGTVAAARVGRRDWVWLCAIGGSPAVARFALFEPEGPVLSDPAPVAALFALVAGGAIAVALGLWLLGI